MEEILDICKTPNGLIVNCESVEQSIELFEVVHMLSGEKVTLLSIRAIQDMYRENTCHRIRNSSGVWLYTHDSYEWYTDYDMPVYQFSEFASMAFGCEADSPIVAEDIDIASLF